MPNLIELINSTKEVLFSINQIYNVMKSVVIFIAILIQFELTDSSLISLRSVMNALTYVW